jgi:anti-sigma factor RsiW
MNESEQLKLQAYLDGELTERERADVAALLDAEEDARRLLAELQQTRSAIRDNEPGRSLDCSREFYWKGIAAKLASSPGETAPTPGVNLMQWLRGHVRSLVGTGVAVAALALLLTLFGAGPAVAESDWEVLHPQTGMVSLRDYQSGITVVMLYDRTKPDFTSGE